MGTQHINRLKSAEPRVVHTHHDNWNVMKPFVHFAVKAMKVIGLGLIAIVRGVLSLKSPSKQNTTNTIQKR